MGYRPLSRGPLPWATSAAMTGVAMVAKDEEFAVMLVVQYVARSRPSELRDLVRSGQVIRPLRRKQLGHPLNSSWKR